MTYQPTPIHDHLPERLTITLWDFSWYTRTGPGEPFEDLDRAFQEAVDRGYNTIRICAMPFLLFGSGLDTSAASFGPLGGDYAQGTRWYDVRHRVTLDARAHLVALFEAARRHEVFVIVSSWEYQQSSSFYGDRSWFDALMAVEPRDRAAALAHAQADLYEFLAERGLHDRVAFVELHNEVQYGLLTGGLEPVGTDLVVPLEKRLTAALDVFHERLPQVPVTVNYARVPVDAMRGIPHNIDVAVFHPYVYGVLGELADRLALRDEKRFSTERTRPFLRPGAPAYEDWQPPAEDLWRKEATIVGKPEIYVHDWCDPEVWDRYLYEHHALHHSAMLVKLDLWTDAARDFSLGRGVPLVFGEGWIGYTPLNTWYEEGPVGKEIHRAAARKARAISAWGSVVTSNAAPHHPMWTEIDIQVECNDIFGNGSPGD
ncbi:cellulase-like family protein [Allonocardiopsis opalescens]|uniref:Sugar-binding cellulase-like protein n=1 Tax=Allonocardiopsis opalescens TaxID=1144618 RepID=A0A2T0QF81_9ACTN|nr:cellulase-like family protein [Allonocardiopsis opalescens]PRY02565.1 sugar-binding cellulase-like protein [Allonocardiopsis opalescens]